MEEISPAQFIVEGKVHGECPRKFRTQDASRAPIPLKVGLLPLFFSYLLTLIPFYHGALRHLDVTYVEKAGREVRSGALLADFLVLFLESCLLFSLAVLLPAPQLYAWGLAALLVVDTGWGFLAHIAFSQSGEHKAELRWALINLLTGGVLCVLLTVIGPFPPQADVTDGKLGVIVLVISVGRSCMDYALNWHFYYPSTPP